MIGEIRLEDLTGSKRHIVTGVAESGVCAGILRTGDTILAVGW
jgi:hypothetical protein